ncbi:S-layer homology domain-containing protein [Sporosarcina sp. P29]|uniref:S-layer homology domain-containing protein n=1 Tax=Sporosarcina sp. P29 TaxID=2048252 RepID=UPI000C165BBA|nr:S-layer homology domain-containing protein [Sporosarcina sp. P29]PIC99878.1 hypothetical protein CSV68_05305 [Sporosarcina sp. P29]
MANQPTKYRKFVVGAASAALVASAVAPVAFAAEFTDVKDNNSHKAAIDALSDAGVISGYPDGTFQPNKTLTRSDVAKLMGKWLIAQGYKVPTDYKTNPRFTDLTSKSNDELLQMAAIVKDNGVFNGNDGKLLPADNITRENMAVVLVRALNTLNDFDLVAYVKEQDWKKDVTDLNKAKAEARPAIDVLDFFDITNPAAPVFNPKNTTTRGQFASFLYKAAETNYDEVKAEDIKVASAKATDSKTITVTFNNAVKDTSKANVELLRGTFKQNATVKWADDKKSVTLEVPGQLQTADYTVNITGLTEKPLTNTVKVEAQKVDSIEILDDLAVLSADGKKATVSFIVKDQYGVDVTTNSNFKVTTGDTDNQKIVGNTVEITNGTSEIKADSKVPVVLIHQATGVTATKVVTVSKASAVMEIGVKGIYDEKGNTVTLNEDTTGKQYLVLNLVDQYGKKVTDAKAVEKMIVTNTNSSVLTLAAKPEIKKIGNANEAVVEISDIKKAGATKAILISSANGATANFDIAVAETTRTDAVALSNPENAILGEDVLLPLSVQDKEGKQITDLKVLKAAVKGISVTNGEVVVKDGKTFVKADTVNKKAGDYVTVLVISSTNKTASVNVKLEAAAVPTIITGVKSPLVVKGTKTVTASDLIVKDQYGRDLAAAKVGDFTVEQVNTNSDILSVSGKDITGKKNGSDKVKIQLAGKPDSAIEVSVQVTDGKEFKSYEVKELGLLDVKAEKANPLAISGVLADGGKVALNANDYKATTNISGVKVVDGKLSVAAKDLEAVFTVDGKKVSERDVKVTFTINNDGSTVEQTYKISNAAPVVKDFIFTSEQSNVEVAKEITMPVDAKGTFTIATAMQNDKVIQVVTTDQFGAKVLKATPDTAKVTIVPANASEVNITNNGTYAAQAQLADNVSKAELTVKVNIGGITKEVKVNLTPQ